VRGRSADEVRREDEYVSQTPGGFFCPLFCRQKNGRPAGHKVTPLVQAKKKKEKKNFIPSQP
jgi:hypothetical protein